MPAASTKWSHSANRMPGLALSPDAAHQGACQNPWQIAATPFGDLTNLSARRESTRSRPLMSNATANAGIGHTDIPTSRPDGATASPSGASSHSTPSGM
jgi:hypothetical protein